MTAGGRAAALAGFAAVILVGLVVPLALGSVIGSTELLIALIWPLWAVGVVELVYGRRPPHRRPLSLGVMRGVIGVIAVASLWEVSARLIDNRLAIVSLPEIWQAFLDLLGSGELAEHVWVSLQEFALGYAAAVVVGIAIGLVLGTNRRVRDYLDPWLSFLYAVPLVAIAPLFIVVLGVGVFAKVVVVFLVVVFVIILNTQVGVMSTDKHLIEAATSFGATRNHVFRKVLLPAALPFIVAGLRLGVARGLVGVTVAELFGARAGLGFFIQRSAQVFQTAELLVGVLTLAIAGFVGVEALKIVELRMAPYRQIDRED